MAYSAPKIKRLPNPSNIPGQANLPAPRGGKTHKAAGNTTLDPYQGVPHIAARKANPSNVPKAMGPSIAAQAATRARGAAARAAKAAPKANPSNVPKSMGPSMKGQLQAQLKKYKR